MNHVHRFALVRGSLPFPGMVLLVFLAAPAHSEEAGAAAVPPREPVLRRSEVAFMYASTPEAYRAYGATFVAWGGAETPEA